MCHADRARAMQRLFRRLSTANPTWHVVGAGTREIGPQSSFVQDDVLAWRETFEIERTRRVATAESRAPRRTACLRCLREANGEPVLCNCDLPGIRWDLLDGDVDVASVFATLAGAGLVPTAGRAAISAEAATVEDAKLLGVKRGEPLLVERRLIHDDKGVPLELTESRYLGTRYGLDVDFDVELPR